MALTDLLDANEAWARHTQEADPGFFETLAKGQTPEHLWIGCSDSRVPPSTITGTAPGSIFVHRNIANMVVSSDTNLLSVLEYAVSSLRVKHVIVGGHYGCGGVAAALGHAHLDEWLRNIKVVYHHNRQTLDAADTPTAQLNRLVELNVVEQVHNLARTSVIQRAWAERDGPTLHGWVYDMGDGRLKELVQLGPQDGVPDIFRYDFD